MFGFCFQKPLVFYLCVGNKYYKHQRWVHRQQYLYLPYNVIYIYILRRLVHSYFLYQLMLLIRTIPPLLIGVYATWNVYVMAMLIFYAPSHKKAAPGSNVYVVDGKWLYFYTLSNQLFMYILYPSTAYASICATPAGQHQSYCRLS